jgi:hypothetical protein
MPDLHEPVSREGGLVIAITADDDQYIDCRKAAMDLAAEAKASLLLYDWDAATVLGDPLPSAWSGHQAPGNVPFELGPEDLERAGREAIARQVVEARARGLHAAAWLPATPGLDGFVEFARARGADTLVVPAHVRSHGGLERLFGGETHPRSALDDQTDLRIVEIPDRERDAD